MNIKVKAIFLLFAILFSLARICAQSNESCSMKISISTCSPGKDLYSSFGHTALRLRNNETNADVVFNYGTFDFNDPDFYVKFVKGKLSYYLSVQDYYGFLAAYRQENRSVIEQELQLSCQQKQAIEQALSINFQPANRYYKYDFLKDNCTTRIRDLIFKNNAKFTTRNIIPANTSARNLIDDALAKAGQWWSRLGIDILLGSKADKPLSNEQAMFLPEFLLHGIDSTANKDGSAIVLKKINPVTTKQAERIYRWNMPLVVLTLICFILFLLYKLKYKNRNLAMNCIDFMLFCLSGFAGVLILFMWFGTDHTICRNNYNLLWAVPLNLIAAFFVFKPYRFRWYFIALSVLYGLLLIGWYLLPQQLNLALLPAVLLFLYRSIKLSYMSVKKNI